MLLVHDPNLHHRCLMLWGSAVQSFNGDLTSSAIPLPGSDLADSVVKDSIMYFIFIASYNWMQ
jgi:hypothetical protein